MVKFTLGGLHLSSFPLHYCIMSSFFPAFCAPPPQVPMRADMTKLTLNVIGLSAFGYEFDAMNKRDEVSAAVGMWSSPTHGLKVCNM